MKILKKIVYDLILVFINYIVAYIPCWHIRKLFYLLFGMKIGKGSRINQRVFIYNPWGIIIGSNSIINSQCIIDGRGKLEIGSNTSLSMRSIVYTASHRTYSATFEYYEKETKIGDCCWICAGSVILPGTILRDLVIVSANSVLKGDTVEKGVYAGIPAKMINEREISERYTMCYREFFT